MSTITEIENAVATLSLLEKYELYRFLAGQRQGVPKEDKLLKGHGVLDIFRCRDLAHPLSHLQVLLAKRCGTAS
jgi:hypothetical protein